MLPVSSFARRGLHVPCVLWPSTYVSQEIGHTAISPDGSRVVAACSSGQVYIFRRRQASSGLDPEAVTVAGWLGPTRVIGLDFCFVGDSAEVVGLCAPNELLVVCLLPGSRIRLLNPNDGRCVAALPPFTAAAQAMAAEDNVLVKVLKDGHHAVLSGLGLAGEALAVVDLWSNRAVATLASPDGLPILRLAAPRITYAGSGAPSRDSPLELAGLGGESVFAWRWSATERPNSQQSRPPPVAPLFSLSFSRSYGSVSREDAHALKFENGRLVVGLHGRVLVVHVAEAVKASKQFGAEIGSGSNAVIANVVVPGLAGVELLRTLLGEVLPHAHPDALDDDGCELEYVELDDSDREKHDSRRRHSKYRRARSCVAMSRPSKAGHRDETNAVHDSLTVVAWTDQGKVTIGSLDCTDIAAQLMLEPCGVLPATADTAHCCWSIGRLGDEGAFGVAVGLSGDVLHSSTLTPLPLLGRQMNKPLQWTRSASLPDVWQGDGSISSTAPVHARISNAALFEVRRRTYLALALLQQGSKARMAVVSATREPVSNSCDSSNATSSRLLELPNTFADPTCLLALGPRFLAAADNEGMLCWWSLPEMNLAGTLPATCRAPVLHLARIWSGFAPVGGDGLLPDAALAAALDAIGYCRVVDLSSGEVRCVLQSQTGLSLWLDEPLRFTHDVAGGFIFAATPTRSWAWDAASGRFEGSAAQSTESPETNPSGRAGAQSSSSTTGVLGTGPADRCGVLRCPGFGVDAVAWQESATAHQGGSAASMASPWRLGEVFLDGPLWRLPVVLLSVSSLFARGAALPGEHTLHRQPGGSQTTGAAVKDSSEGDSTAGNRLGGMGGETSSTVADAETAATLSGLLGLGIEPAHLQAQLADLGVKLSAFPFVVGSVGVDGSLSLPLPRRRGARQRSAPSSSRCRGSQETSHCSRGVATIRPPRGSGDTYTASWAAASERLLQAAGERAQQLDQRRPHATAQPELPVFAAAPLPASPPALSSEPCVGFAVVVRLLLQSESSALVLQRCALPVTRRLLTEAPLVAVVSTIKAWIRLLQTDVSSGGRESACFPGLALRIAAFGSASGARDAAAVLLAVVAIAQPELFDRFCPAAVGAPVTEVLCVRMLSRSSGLHMQSLACELFAAAFTRWRRHLSLVLPSGRRSGGTANKESSTGPETVLAAVVHTGATPAPSGIDEELEWLANQALTSYQEPRIAPSVLNVLMQVGAADPTTLIMAMGKAARRLDLGAAYASSALFVLVAFIHRHAPKVMPLLPRFTEVVLRCLEPSDPALRRQSLLAVTSALHELVQTFPMVAFHQPSQKFAVGTGDGLVIVYDLRTATKWRLLEGHTGAVAGLAFSRDGGKLSSYSALDSTLRIWQCSSQGFLGGLLGSSGRCLKVQQLPVTSTSSVSGSSSGISWRNVSLAWTERGPVRLVRENGETVQLHAD